ncbi:MAG: ATP phosphoribosyltransferase [Candidatus Hodgkinia cicadicola]
MAVSSFVLPSKGRIREAAEAVVGAVGRSLACANPRCYLAELESLSGVDVWRLPAAGVAAGLVAGAVDLGMTGLDLVKEAFLAGAKTDVGICRQFDVCRADIGLLVPKLWSDVSSVDELRALSLARPLTVVTKYVNLTRRYLIMRGLSTLSVEACDTAAEVEAFHGRDVVVADVVSSGCTAKYNLLKPLDGSRIVSTSLCLFYNVHAQLTSDALTLIRSLCCF